MTFRVRVVGLDNMRGSEFEVLYVEAGIYHGGELLGETKYTTEVSMTPYPRWNQWLVFELPIKCLPKAARLCLQVLNNAHHHTPFFNLTVCKMLQVVGGNRQKDVKKKSLRGRKNIMRDDKKGEGQFDKSLHWVNMQILDHRSAHALWLYMCGVLSEAPFANRSLLRQGLVRLNLWPILPEAQRGSSSVSSQFSPMGSTAINPDGNNSAVLYIELDTYAHPVACPTHGWGEDTPM